MLDLILQLSHLAASDAAGNALCAANRCPRIHWLLGESHMSEVYSINTADRALTDLMLAFMRRPR